MNTNKIYKVGAALAMSSMCSVTSFANSSIIQATNAVNMRSGPGMSYKVLDVIPDNAKVEYISTKGNWIKVKYDGKIGYSYKSYFNLKVESNKKEGVISVGTSRLNIRKQPTTTSYIMGKLYTGDKVTIVGESGDWYKIKTKMVQAIFLNVMLN